MRTFAVRANTLGTFTNFAHFLAESTPADPDTFYRYSRIQAPLRRRVTRTVVSPREENHSGSGEKRGPR
jgi:hypothetical protein